MDCSNCGSPSAHFYKINKEGAEKEVCLCEECYKRLYPKEDASELFAHLFGASGNQTKKSEVCPSCGMTFERFRKTGLLGCADCYPAFRNELYNAVRYCQWDVVHKGKQPSGVSEEKYDLVREQEVVKSQIDSALLAGDFKLAERLNRELKAIKMKLLRAEE